MKAIFHFPLSAASLQKSLTCLQTRVLKSLLGTNLTLHPLPSKVARREVGKAGANIPKISSPMKLVQPEVPGSSTPHSKPDPEEVVVGSGIVEAVVNEAVDEVPLLLARPLLVFKQQLFCQTPCELSTPTTANPGEEIWREKKNIFGKCRKKKVKE